MKYKISNLSQGPQFLHIKISHLDTSVIQVSQKVYMTTILTWFDTVDIHDIATLICPNIKFNLAENRG